MFKHALLLGFVFVQFFASADTKTRNVVLITIDGLRWQEVFRGAEEALMIKDYQVHDTNQLRREFWRDTPEQRRESLMPFFWNVIAKQGQLYGNDDKGSSAVVTNGKKFTYPGFNEIFTGSPDPRIDSNNKHENPNVSVFEWLHQKPAFKGKAAGFVNWEIHPYIINAKRSGIPVWSGYDTNYSTITAVRGSRFELLQQVQRDTTALWGDMTFDSFYFYEAREYMKEHKPRLQWIAFSETDEWAHEGHYDHYLHAIHQIDSYVRRLWETAQSIREYRDKTTFVLVCDHGRGSGDEWRNHGAKVAGAEKVWQAYLGPDTHPLGERTNIAQVTHSQVAATIAALVGEDYHAAVPASGVAIKEVLP